MLGYFYMVFVNPLFGTDLLSANARGSRLFPALDTRVDRVEKIG